MKTTKTDFFGRAINGYGEDVKTFIAKKLDLPIEYMADCLIEYLETNYYAWWYYEVVGGGDDESTWFGIEKCIKEDVIRHAIPLLVAHGSNELRQLCDRDGIQY